jgi:hypothetical protein
MAAKFKKGVDLVNQKGINAADPTAATDIANKQYVDSVAAGRDWKESVRVATTANLTIASPGATINGVTMAANDRVLVKNQTTGSENGIYVWNGAAVPMTRSTDADSSAEMTGGATVAVNEGTVDPDTRWTLTTNDAIVLGTTSLTWSKDATGGGGYATVQENASGLTQRTILNFNVGLVATDNAGSTRTDVDIDTAVVARKFAADCAATTNPQTFTHGLGTDIDVAVWETNERVWPDITKAATSGGQVTVDWGGAPTAGQYRVVVIG